MESNGKVYLSSPNGKIYKTSSDVLKDFERFSMIMQVMTENMKEAAWSRFASGHDYGVLSALIGEASARLAEANKYVTGKIAANEKRVF